MIEFESKRKFKKRLYSKFTLFLLVILLAFVSFKTYQIYAKHSLVKNSLESSTVVLEDYQDREQKLEDEIARIDSDVGKEAVLRENYSLAKEGEKAIYIINRENEQAEVVEEPDMWQKVRTWWGGLFN